MRSFCRSTSLYSCRKFRAYERNAPGWCSRDPSGEGMTDVFNLGSYLRRDNTARTVTNQCKSLMRPSCSQVLSVTTTASHRASQIKVLAA